jgi:hypothetical protein
MNSTDQGKPHEPIATSQNLPAEPLRLADVPTGADVRFGWLGWYCAPTGRPLVYVTIRCARCRADHRHPWRWGWGISPDIVSYQAARCFKGERTPYWIALDAKFADENAEIHAEAHDAFQAWAAERAEAKSARGKVPDTTEAEAGG